MCCHSLRVKPLSALPHPPSTLHPHTFPTWNRGLWLFHLQPTYGIKTLATRGHRRSAVTTEPPWLKPHLHPPISIYMSLPGIGLQISSGPLGSASSGHVIKAHGRAAGPKGRGWICYAKPIQFFFVFASFIFISNANKPDVWLI